MKLLLLNFSLNVNLKHFCNMLRSVSDTFPFKHSKLNVDMHMRFIHCPRYTVVYFKPYYLVPCYESNICPVMKSTSALL